MAIHLTSPTITRLQQPTLDKTHIKSCIQYKPHRKPYDRAMSFSNNASQRPKPTPLRHPSSGSDTLKPLTDSLQIGLIPVALLGCLSAISSIALLCILTWRIWSWNRRAYSMNQFVFLIYNLVLSDIQQAFGFTLSAHWLISNSIHVSTATCWAQGCKYQLVPLPLLPPSIPHAWLQKGHCIWERRDMY